VNNATTEPAERMDVIKFKSLTSAGAEYLCVACPSCYLQLESVQKGLKKNFNLDVNVPVLYFTEFLALALGISSDAIGLNFHTVKPKDLIDQFK
jgi:heterodisulfide reductase subunit B